MYKIAVIGDGQSVAGFLAAGLDTFPCDDPAQARTTLSKLVKSGDYAIIYVTENLCGDMAAEFEKYKDRTLPAIIPIPGISGSSGFGTAKAKMAVERAVGVDVIYGNSK